MDEMNEFFQYISGHQFPKKKKKGKMKEMGERVFYGFLSGCRIKSVKRECIFPCG